MLNVLYSAHDSSARGIGGGMGGGGAPHMHTITNKYAMHFGSERYASCDGRGAKKGEPLKTDPAHGRSAKLFEPFPPAAAVVDDDDDDGRTIVPHASRSLGDICERR